MIRIMEIIDANDNYIICKFNNSEIRKMDFMAVFPKESRDNFIDKILETNQLTKAKIGEFGQLYWENAATIKELNGNLSPCEYDISSEFFFHHSSIK